MSWNKLFVVNEFKELVQKTRNIEKSIGISRTKPYLSEIKFKDVMWVSIGTSKNIKSGTKINAYIFSSLNLYASNND